MKTLKNSKELVNDMRYGVPRHCEEGKRSVARRGNLYKNVVFRLALANSKKRKDNNMTKELVKEKVAKQNGSRDAIPTPCGRGSGCVSEASYNHRGGVNSSIDSQNPSPQPSPARGEGACSKNSSNPQSLINSNHFTHLTHSTHFTHLRKRPAFTLAEVLITLAVIGIVAAMTIPNLVQSYKKKVVETRLVQFYSMMNQAVKLSEIDHGEEFSWLPFDSSTLNLVPYSIEEYFNEYLAPYLKTAKTEVNLDGEEPHIRVYFANGSTVYITNQATKDRSPHFWFFPFGVVKGTYADCNSGIDCFLFMQNLQQFSSASVLYQHGVQPYTWINGKRWAPVTDKDEIDKILRDDTTRGCNNLQNVRAYCTAVIMRNGWKIPEDYPFKF